MSQTDPVRLYVTHAFDEGEDYLRVFEFLESARDFFYVNMSRPEAPRPSDREALKEALRLQIRPAEIVIALGSLGRENEQLLEFQMAYAQSLPRPVLLIPGFGKDAWLPPKWTTLASETGQWDARAIVDSVRRLARHEETSRWDTVEFKLDD
jgi:hypothetical protein